MRIVGPNCMGVVNVPGHLNASYFWDVPKQPGGISFVSQSGAYGGLFFREVRQRSLGVAEVPLDREPVRPRLRGVPRVARRRSRHARGGALRRGDPGRAGVRRVRAAAVAREARGRAQGRPRRGGPAGGRLPHRLARRDLGDLSGRLRGRRHRGSRRDRGAVRRAGDPRSSRDAVARDAAIAILTISGGPSVVAADTAEAAGLQVPPLPAERRTALRAHLPDFGADGNPVDMTPQMEPGGFEPSVRLVLEAAEISGAVAIDIGLDRPEYADALVRHRPPPASPWLRAPSTRRTWIAGSARAVSRSCRGPSARSEPTGRSSVVRRAVATSGVSPRAPCGRLAREPRIALRAARGPLGHADARALLEAYGVPFARERIVATAREALSSAGRSATLWSSRRRARTSSTGPKPAASCSGWDAEALSRAVEAIEARLGPGPLLVQEEVPQGLELLVGGRRDPSFGPTVVVGLGGLLAEFLRDASVGLAPLSRETARALIAEGRRPALLRGFRGGTAVDQDALAGLLSGSAIFWWIIPPWELDLNPLIASAGRLVAVDALVLVNPRDDARRT